MELFIGINGDPGTGTPGRGWQKVYPACVLFGACYGIGANQIGANGLLIAAAGGIGGGLASVLGPAKLMAASVTIDRLGEENAVLRASIPLSLFLTGIVSILCLIWA